VNLVIVGSVINTMWTAALATTMILLAGFQGPRPGVTIAADVTSASGTLEDGWERPIIGDVNSAGVMLGHGDALVVESVRVGGAARLREYHHRHRGWWTRPRLIHGVRGYVAGLAANSKGDVAMMIATPGDDWATTFRPAGGRWGPVHVIAPTPSGLPAASASSAATRLWLDDMVLDDRGTLFSISESTIMTVDAKGTVRRWNHDGTVVKSARGELLATWGCRNNHRLCTARRSATGRWHNSGRLRVSPYGVTSALGPGGRAWVADSQGLWAQPRGGAWVRRHGPIGDAIAAGPDGRVAGCMADRGVLGGTEGAVVTEYTPGSGWRRKELEFLGRNHYDHQPCTIAYGRRAALTVAWSSQLRVAGQVLKVARKPAGGHWIGPVRLAKVELELQQIRILIDHDDNTLLSVHPDEGALALNAYRPHD